MESTKRFSSLRASALTGSQRLTIGLGAVALGMALALPAPAQEQPSLGEPPITTVTESQDGSTADVGSASVGATAPDAEGTPVQADPEHQGANPANQWCDALQGQAREDCLKTMSTGGAIQQGIGD